MGAMITETGRQQKSIKNKFHEAEAFILFVFKDAPRIISKISIKK